MRPYETRLKALESRVPDSLVCFGSVGGVVGEYGAKQLYDAPDGQFQRVLSGNSIADISLILSIFRERAYGQRE